MTIEPIVHQMWATRDIPLRFAPYVSSWYVLLPDYRHIFWTDAEIVSFIGSEFPEFSEIYRGLPQSAIRFDLARYLILQSFGGLYVDIDFECYQNPDVLFADCSLVLGWEWAGSSCAAATGKISLDIEAMRRFFLVPRENPNTLGNSFIAASKQHPFIRQCIQRVVTHSIRMGDTIPAREVWNVSGPLAITKVFLDSFEPSWSAHILPSSSIFPIGWQTPERDDGFRGRDFPQAYAAHHWAGTWWQPQPEEPATVPMSEIEANPSKFIFSNEHS